MRAASLRTSALGTALLGLGLLLGLSGGVRAAPGTYHEDNRVGFKVKTPKGWNEAPLKADERWIVMKYISDKEDVYLDEVDKSTWTDRPDVTAIAFIDEVVKKEGVEATEDEDGGVIIEFNNPYKNYKDFLQRTYNEGGWFISDEQQDEVNGIPVTQYEIKVEKLTRTAPKRIVTWVFDLEDVDLAVQFIVLECKYDDYKSDIRACLKSFKAIPRTEGSLTPTTTEGPRKWVDEDELKPEERRKYRQEQEAITHRKNIQTLPDDWKVKEMGRFLVLLHGDEKYAKKVVEQAEAVWKWLDKEFGFIGKDEYVPRPIIRICKDLAEERAFFSGTAWGSGIEITTHKDPGSGSLSWEFEYVNQRMLAIWFNHRNRDLYWALPYWIDLGLDRVIGKAVPKGSGLEFKVDEWERDGLRESARGGNLTPPRELVTLPKAEFWNNEHRIKQSAAWVRYLLESKSKRTKSILTDYLKNLQDILEEQKKAAEAEKPEASKPPETEEEEEQRFAARREAMKEREAEFLKEAFERTFGDWDDKDWKKVADQYYKSM